MNKSKVIKLYERVLALNKAGKDYSKEMTPEQTVDVYPVLEMFAAYGINGGSVIDGKYVYKHKANNKASALTPQQALTLVECGILPQSPMEVGAFLVFGSGTVLEIKKISKGVSDLAKSFDGKTEEIKYSTKEVSNMRCVCVDFPIITG